MTSTSVKIGDKNIQKWPRKRSRKTSAELPDSLIDISRNLPEMPSILHQMAMKHVEKTHQESTSTTQTTPSTTTTMTTTTTFPELTTTTKKISDVPKIINSVKTFTRYYIPPEVKISSKAVGASE